MDATTRWLWRGTWAVPIFGLLTLLSTFDHQPDPSTRFDEWSRFVTTDRFLASHLIGSILGQAIWLLGAAALTAVVLPATRRPRQALVGFVISVLGGAGLLAGFGTAAFAQPAIGRAQLAGVAAARPLFDDVYGTPALVVLIPAVVLFSAASVLLGRATLADDRLSKWGGALFAASGPLIGIAGVPIGVLQTVGSIAAIAGGTGLALSLRSRPARLRSRHPWRRAEYGAQLTERRWKSEQRSRS